MPNLVNSLNRTTRSQVPYNLQDVKDTFDYNPDSGEFTYKGTSTPAGYLHPDGALYICIGRKNTSVHRLCWYIYYGEWPMFNLRHLNGDKADNRIANLARATWENDRSRARYKADAGTSRGDLAAATPADTSLGADYYPGPTDTPRW